MNSEDAVLGALDVLERTKTPYMVVGSLSCNVYTFPRSTHDADFVVQLEPENVDPLLAELRRLFRVDPQATFESITATTRFAIESMETGFRVELFLLTRLIHGVGL